MSMNHLGMHSLYPVHSYDPVVSIAKATDLGSGLLSATFDGVNSRQVPAVSSGWVAAGSSFPVVTISGDSQKKVGLGSGGWIS